MLIRAHTTESRRDRIKRLVQEDIDRLAAAPVTLDPERARALDLFGARTAVVNTARDLETAHGKVAILANKPLAMPEADWQHRKREAALQLKWARDKHDAAQRRLAEVKAQTV